MRTPADLPRRRPRSSRRRNLLLAAAGALILVFTLGSSASGFYTDSLWFSDLGFRDVFYGVLGAKVLLFVVFLALGFGIVFVNLVITDRMAPKGLRRGPDDELVQRYREAVGRHTGKVRIGLAAFVALLLASGVSGHWQDYLLWRNRVPFGGATDPQFHKDASFYVFDLPFRTFVVGWLLFAVLAAFVVSTVLHYLNGGIRLQVAQARGATPQVKAHLSVLLALVAFLKAYAYWLERYSLVYSKRGFAQGAFYTDVKAKLPALGLLTLISVAAGVLLVANIWRRGFALPAVSAGLWFLVTVVVGSIYPAVIQQFQVKPAERSKEAPYIARNIAGTRRAFGLDQISEVPITYSEAPGAVTPADLQDDAATVRNIRLWDPYEKISKQTFAQLQSLKGYYQVIDTDIDRYSIDGQPTQVVVAARELSPANIPQDNWVNRHLAYTHGYGAIIAPANSATADGYPGFTLKDLPPTPEMKEPRIYFGEQGGPGDYAIVGTKQPEIDQANGSTYTGTRGVRLSSVVRRAAFALRFRELNVLISGLITPESRVLYVRQIQDRVQKIAPFLTYDRDPYAVVLDGHVYWVIDAYTTTSRFPYSQSVPVTGSLEGVNYARNSVKVVVDAYDGTTTFYAIDQKDRDPLLESYRKAFPKLFTDISKAPAGLTDHFRYPEDLFTLQASLYGRYHITNPADFFSATDRWDLSPNPGVTAVSGAASSATPLGGAQGAQQGGAVTVRQLTSGDDKTIPATYQLQRLPGDPNDSFSILLPYVPFTGGSSTAPPQLTAYLTARSDPGEYGKLVLYRMPAGQQINGPSIVAANIKSDPDISREITLLNTQGSEVLFGNILLVPIKDSIVYVRPLYVQASEGKQVPKLVRVIAVYGNRAVMKNTLQEALTELFGGAPSTLEDKAPPGGGTTGTTTPSTPPSGGTGGTGTLSPQAADLLRQANDAYVAAQAALRAGDLAGYQKAVDQAAKLVQQAAQAAGVTSSSAPTTTTTTTAAPSTPTTASG